MKITYEKVSVADFDKIIKLPTEKAKIALRQLRNEECFSVTDRPLWYTRLLQSQKNELNSWYEEWLNITETFELPIKPEWLK